MWVWYLGEPDDALNFKSEIAIKKRNREEESELKYTGRVHRYSLGELYRYIQCVSLIGRCIYYHRKWQIYAI